MAKTSTIRRQTPTLTAYLARRFAVYLIATLTTLALLTYLIDAVALLNQAGGKGVSPLTTLTMSAMKLPDLMQQLLPFAVLLATLVTLNQLNRSHELVALRAAGLPARRIMLGPLLVVILTGAMALGILNPLAATMLKRYEVWHAQTFPGSAKGLVTKGGTIWLKQQVGNGETTFIYAQKVGERGQNLYNASIFILTPEGTLAERIESPHITLHPGQWDITSPTFIPSRSEEKLSTTNYQLPTALTPTLIQNSFTRANTLSVWELGPYIRNLATTGFPTNAHSTMYNRLIALPAFLIAMFLLGVPFALTFSRTRNLATTIGLGLALGFGFYLFGNIMAGYGMAGRLNPTLAAWAPTAIASLAAMALLIYLREE